MRDGVIFTGNNSIFGIAFILNLNSYRALVALWVDRQTEKLPKARNSTKTNLRNWRSLIQPTSLEGPFSSNDFHQFSPGVMAFKAQNINLWMNMIMFWIYISQKLAIVPADYVVYFLYTFLDVIVFNSARNSHAVYEENLPFWWVIFTARYRMLSPNTPPVANNYYRRINWISEVFISVLAGSAIQWA